MRRVIDEFPTRVLIGEIYLPIERLVAYYGRDLRGAHLPFNFSAAVDALEARATIAALIAEYEAALAARRLAELGVGQSRPAPPRESDRDATQARIAAMLLLTLRGTPTLYYGDEIGMRQVRDSAGARAGPVREERARSARPRRLPHADAMGRKRLCRLLDRRALAAARRGFRRDNVESQRADPASLLNLYRRLIALRRARPALSKEPIGRSRPMATFWPTSGRGQATGSW